MQNKGDPISTGVLVTELGECMFVCASVCQSCTWRECVFVFVSVCHSCILALLVCLESFKCVSQWVYVCGSYNGGVGRDTCTHACTYQH